MHTCDNPPCCNPAHLRAVLPIVNDRDKVQKKRHYHGEKHWRARLKVKDVRCIRKMIARGMTAKSIAAEFGIHSMTVYDIKWGRSWAATE